MRLMGSLAGLLASLASERKPASPSTDPLLPLAMRKAAACTEVSAPGRERASASRPASQPASRAAKQPEESGLPPALRAFTPLEHTPQQAGQPVQPAARATGPQAVEETHSSGDWPGARSAECWPRSRAWSRRSGCLKLGKQRRRLPGGRERAWGAQRGGDRAWGAGDRWRFRLGLGVSRHGPCARGARGQSPGRVPGGQSEPAKEAGWAPGEGVGKRLARRRPPGV